MIQMGGPRSAGGDALDDGGVLGRVRSGKALVRTVRPGVRLLILQRLPAWGNGEVAVDGGSGDAEGLGDLGRALAARVADGAAASLSAFMTVGPAAGTSLGAGGGQPGHGAFVDDVTFELGEGGHHGEEEFALPAGGIGAGQLSGEDAHADAALVRVAGDDQDVPLLVDQIAVYSPASGLTGR